MVGVTGVRVSVGQGVREDVGVGEMYGVRVGGIGVGVRDEVGVGEEVRVGAAVGGLPVTLNSPAILKVSPAKTWTW
jgi:hypothetical protein